MCFFTCFVDRQKKKIRNQIVVVKFCFISSSLRFISILLRVLSTILNLSIICFYEQQLFIKYLYKTFPRTN